MTGRIEDLVEDRVAKIQEEETPKKRGRGRPRKHPLPETEETGRVSISPDAVDLLEREQEPSEAAGLPVEGEIPITDIIISPDYYPRQHTDPGIIQKYATCLDRLPRIHINPSKLLVDGLHRIEAHRQEGQTTIKYTRLNIPDELVFLEAVRRNAAHGHQLTTSDKRDAARRLYMAGNEIKLIADVISVSERTVRLWTQDLRERDQAKTESKIRELVKEGKTQREIAEEVDLSPGRIGQLLSNGKIAKTKQDESSDALETEIITKRQLSESNNFEEPKLIQAPVRAGEATEDDEEEIPEGGVTYEWGLSEWDMSWRRPIPGLVDNMVPLPEILDKITDSFDVEAGDVLRFISEKGQQHLDGYDTAAVAELIDGSMVALAWDDLLHHASIHELELALHYARQGNRIAAIQKEIVERRGDPQGHEEETTDEPATTELPRYPVVASPEYHKLNDDVYTILDYATPVQHQPGDLVTVKAQFTEETVRILQRWTMDINDLSDEFLLYNTYPQAHDTRQAIHHLTQRFEAEGFPTASEEITVYLVQTILDDRDGYERDLQRLHQPAPPHEE